MPVKRTQMRQFFTIEPGSSNKRTVTRGEYVKYLRDCACRWRTLNQHPTAEGIENKANRIEQEHNG